MTLFSRPLSTAQTVAAPAETAPASAYNPAETAVMPVGVSAEEMDPHVQSVARAVRVAGPETRVAVLAEMLRSGPYRAVPVVAGAVGDGSESSNGALAGGGPLVGMVTEDDLLRALLSAGDPASRSRVRELPARAVMRPAGSVVHPWERISGLSARFAEAGADVLPVVDDPDSMRFLGLISRADLVRDLVRPFRPPMVGGMATPLGVYLTTGGASGGVGTLGLAATGMFSFALSTVSTVALAAVGRLAGAAVHATPWLSDLRNAAVAAVPQPVVDSFTLSVPYAVEFGLFLFLLRLSPLARYHAAEHQVVHAIERGEPLLPGAVKQMPRVHPRCSTNLVAAGLILWLTLTALTPLTGPELAWAVAAFLAVGLWKHAGPWLQDRFTTQPAGDREIESAIRAAREVLDAHGRAPDARPKATQRLWRMGFAQIFLGAGAGLLLAIALGKAFPALAPLLSL